MNTPLTTPSALGRVRPLDVMLARIDELPYLPETIDADALRGNAVPPARVRRAVPARA